MRCIETEIRTGKPSDLPRNVSEEQAMSNPDVQKAVTEHLAELVRLCACVQFVVAKLVDYVC